MPFLASWLYLCAHYVIKHYVNSTAKQVNFHHKCVMLIGSMQLRPAQMNRMASYAGTSMIALKALWFNLSTHISVPLTGERFDFVPSRAYLDFGIYEWKLGYHCSLWESMARAKECLWLFMTAGVFSGDF